MITIWIQGGWKKDPKVFRKNHVMTQADMIKKIGAKTMSLGESPFCGQVCLRIVRPISLTSNDRELLVRKLILQNFMKRANFSESACYARRTCAFANEISSEQSAMHGWRNLEAIKWHIGTCILDSNAHPRGPADPGRTRRHRHHPSDLLIDR